MPVGREVGDELHVVAETDDGDAILRAGGVEEVERGLAYEVNPFFDAAGNVEQEYEVERRVRRRNFAHATLDAVFRYGEIFFRESADGPTVAVCDARLHARESCARLPFHVEGVRARAEHGFACALRQSLDVLADETRRGLSYGVNEFGVAASDDCARGLCELAFAQVVGNGRLVFDAEEDDAALRFERELRALVRFRLLAAEVSGDLERAAALAL